MVQRPAHEQPHEHPGGGPRFIDPCERGGASTANKYSSTGSAQALPEAIERIACLLMRDLGVDLHGGLEVGVPSNLHGHSAVHVQVGKQGTASTPGIVDRDPAFTRLLTATIPRTEGSSEARSEYRTSS
jgi:hypothetical protein